MYKQNQNRPFFSILEEKNVAFSPTNHGFLGGLYLYLNQRFGKRPFLYFAVESTFILALAAPVIAAALTLTTMPVLSAILGVAALVFGVKQHNKFKQYQPFSEFLSATSKLTPPTSGHPMFKTKELTFNQAFSFAADANNIIWIAPRLDRKAKPQWRPLYIEGYKPNPQLAIDMKADGKNFQFAQFNRYAQEEAIIYYKEVMTFKREGSVLHVQDISGLPESENQWFSLPVLSTLMFWKRNQRLSFDASKSRWLMANAGALRAEVSDGMGHYHELWNCTTVWVQQGNLLKMHDPYVKEGTEMVFSLPPGVNILDLEASASRLVILGEKSVDGKPAHCILERDVSYDDLHLNPAMKTSVDIRDKNKRVFRTDWRELDVPKGFITGKLNVIQTGQRDERQISLEATKELERGFYYTSGQRWYFAKSNHPQVLEPEAAFPMNPICKLRGKKQTFFGKHIAKVSSPHFDEHMLDGIIQVQLEEGQTVNFKLIQDGNLITSFLKGKFDKHWVMALTPECQTEANLQWLGGKPSLEVTIESKSLDVTLSCGSEKLTFKSSLVHQQTVRFSSLELFMPDETDFQDEAKRNVVHASRR